MRLSALAAVLAAGVSAVSAVQAVEPYVVYDRFDERPLDPKRWFESERIRNIRGGGLHLMQRYWGTNTSDSGVTASNWNNSLPNPAAITQMRARVRVNAIEANTCPSNPAVADARARLIGSFFNVGTPTPGSQVGDVLAQVRLLRVSNSADAADVLRVQGIVSVCSSPDCALAATVGNIVDLGTVAVGTPTVVQMQWDQGGKTFTFSRDNGTFIGTVAYTYSDTTPPSSLFRQLSTRVNVPNCQAAPRVSGVVDARFDNVFVNQSATSAP